MDTDVKRVIVTMVRGGRKYYDDVIDIAFEGDFVYITEVVGGSDYEDKTLYHYLNKDYVESIDEV